MGSSLYAIIADNMEGLDGVVTKDEVLRWSQTCRKWKYLLQNNMSREQLLNLCTILTGTKKIKTKASLATEAISAIEQLRKTTSAFLVQSAAASSSHPTDDPPAKVAKLVEKAVGVPSLTTPQPSRTRSRSRSARRGATSSINEEAPTPARSPYAAEALAMSTRKSEASAPVSLPTLPTTEVVTTSVSSSADASSDLLLVATNARSRVLALVKALKELQGDGSHPVWPKQRGAENGLYHKLLRVRTEYKQAMAGEIDNPFNIDDLRLLVYFLGSGSGGPQDLALGQNTLGAVESVGNRWRWTFKSVGTSVNGEAHDTEEDAVTDLINLQLKLLPPGMSFD